jgi:hypothetical protein
MLYLTSSASGSVPVNSSVGVAVKTVAVSAGVFKTTVGGSPIEGETEDEGDTDAEGETEALGEILGDTEEDGEIEAEGDTDGDTDGDTEEEPPPPDTYSKAPMSQVSLLASRSRKEPFWSRAI